MVRNPRSASRPQPLARTTASAQPYRKAAPPRCTCGIIWHRYLGVQRGRSGGAGFERACSCPLCPRVRVAGGWSTGSCGAGWCPQYRAAVRSPASPQVHYSEVRRSTVAASRARWGSNRARQAPAARAVQPGTTTTQAHTEIDRGGRGYYR